jgi:RNA polymerase sigma-70 factor (ECF subfamily)
VLPSPEHKLAESLWERAREGWPAVELPRSGFADWLVERFGARLADEHERLELGDLYITAACLLGAPGGMESFKRQLEPQLRRFVASVERRDDAIGELVQELIVRLVIGADGEAPKLAEYSGRGPLRAWLRILAVRYALNRARGQRRRVALEERVASEAARGGEDPELAVLHARYQPQVAEAFRDALAALAPPDRSLLRLVYGQGLGLETIGAMHGWSKPTTSRRVAAVRAAMLDEAMRLLRQRLGASDAEVESVIRLVQSRLDLSLSGLFATASPS